MAEYIERDSVLNIVKGNWSFMNSADDAIQTSIEMIRRLPAADVRPVAHGKWVDVSEKIYTKDLPCAPYYQCDQCKKIKEGYRTNYCPNCGARMEER